MQENLQGIIGLLRSELEMNDGTAQSTIAKAQAAVNDVG